MKSLSVLATVALALAGCSKGDAGGNATAAAAAPVAAKSAPAGTAWTEVVTKTPEGGYRMGNPDAAIKLVEYGSRTCPICGAFGREGMQPLENTYVKSGKVSYEFREFLVHGAQDLPPALVGRCAGAGPFFPLLEQMYVHQADFYAAMDKMTPEQRQAIGSAAPDKAIPMLADAMGVVDFVKQHGVPEAKARACLADKAEIDYLTKTTQDGNGGQVTGTPTFFINGAKVDNVSGWAQLEPALKAHGA